MSSPFDYPISQPHLSFMKLKKQKKQKNKIKQNKTKTRRGENIGLSDH